MVILIIVTAEVFRITIIISVITTSESMAKMVVLTNQWYLKLISSFLFNVQRGPF